MAASLAIREPGLARVATRLERVRDEVEARHGAADPLTRMIDEALRTHDPRVLRMAEAAYEAQRLQDDPDAVPATGNWVFLTAPDGSRIRKPFSFGVFTDLPFERLSELLRLTGLDALRRTLGRHFGGGALPEVASAATGDGPAPAAGVEHRSAPHLARAVGELDELIERSGRPREGSVLAAIEARLREAEEDAKGEGAG